MNRKTERKLARILWILYGSAVAGSLVILGRALFVEREPRPPLPEPEVVDSPRAQVRGHSREEVELLAGKRMSRAVAKTSPAVQTARADTPALQALVRLAGIMKFDKGRPPEALIETPATNETKAYKVGEEIGSTGAKVKEISDDVVVEYAGKKYRLTFLGTEEFPGAVGGAGTSKPGSEH